MEAVAGYKDFNVSSRFCPEELLEELNQDEIHKTSPHKPVPWSEDEFPAAKDYRDSLAETDEPEDVDESDGGIASNGKNENGDGDLADEMSLDGAHILLEDEGLGSERKINHGDASEGDSVGSESGDDRFDGAAIKKRIAMSQDQDGGSVGPYDNPDQHSIHSISNIMTKNMEGSPTVLDDLESFGAFRDGDADLSAENSLLVSAKDAYSHDFQTLSEGEWNVRPTDSNSANSYEVNEEVGSQGLTSENGNGFDRTAQPVLNTLESLTDGEDENLSKHSRNVDLMSSHETLISSCISSPTHRASDKPEDAAIENSEAKELKQKANNCTDRYQKSSSSSSIDEVDAKRTLQASTGFESQPRSRAISDMVRSETEDLMLNLSSDSSGHMTNIRDIAADSVKWLSHKLGPVLATKFLSRNLVRMLALCYLGQEQLQFIEHTSESVFSHASHCRQCHF